MNNMPDDQNNENLPQSSQWFSSTTSTELMRYVDAILKRWPIAVAILFSFLLVSIIYTLGATKEYKATATIVITPYTPQILTDVKDFMPDGNSRSSIQFLKTEYEILESKAVARRTVEKVKLKYDDSHNGLASISDPIRREANRQKIDWARFLQKKITIVPSRMSYTVEIQVIDADAKYAAVLANAVAASYMELNIEKRGDGAKEAAGWLAAQHDELRDKVNASQDLLYSFMLKNEIANASLPNQKEEIKNRLLQFNTKLAEAQSQAISNQVESEEMRRIYKNPELIDSLPGIQNHRVIGDLKNKLVEAKTKLSELNGKYLPAHPTMRSIRDQVESIERALKIELSASIRKSERETQSLQRTQEGLKAAIAVEKKQEGQLNKLSIEYDRLKRESDTNEQLYNMVTNRMKEINLAGMVQINNIHVLGQAEAPPGPFRPSWAKNLLIALALGLFFSLGSVILMDLLDNTIKSKEDVEKFLRLPFLGSMPVIIKDAKSKNDLKAKRASPEKMRERDLYAMRHPSSIIAECARAIRTNLIFMSPEKPLQSMVISSAVPKEGKTTTASNLAATMAQAGARVVLIDGDMRKPRIHTSFSLSNDRGLSSLIVGEHDIDSTIQKTDLENFHIITSGPIPPNPSELLHTKRFKDLITALEQRYDHIIFDAPPINSVTDPVILAKQVGALTMVIKMGGVSYYEAQRAVGTLLDARVRIYGIILNDVEQASNRYAYAYKYGRYYNQRYGNYGADTDASSPASA